MLNNKTLFYGTLIFVVVIIGAGVSVLIQKGQTPLVPHGGPVKDYVSLVDNLRAGGAIVEAVGEVAQPFFSPQGKKIIVNGGEVQVFEYADSELAEADAATVSKDGTTIGTTMITWVAPPHFYTKGRLIVLYIGNDEAVINALEAVLGLQFAGGKKITNFLECARAGYPVLESYPRQCKTPDGRTFVEEL